MSTSQPPRQREVAISAVSRLRMDTTLADELYADAETIPPPDDRQRIYLGNIADRRADDAYVAVLPIATGSTSSGNGLFVKSYLTQVTVAYSENQYERRGALSMYLIRDRCDAVLSEGAPRQYPTGPEGGDSITVDDDGYRLLTNRFRVVVVE